MNWYYADGGQQKGPVSDMDFIVLTRDGIIKGETLVWREGLPEWQPLSLVRPDLVKGVSGAPMLSGMAIPEQSKDLLVQQMREGALPTTFGTANPYSLRYAGFWIRVAAKFIDGILMSVLTIPMMFLLLGGTGVLTGGPEFEQRMKDDPDALMAVLAGYGLFFVFAVGLQLAYNGIMVWKWGATLGKMAVGLRVVRADGQPLALGRSIGRAAADLINSVVCNGILYIMIPFDNPQKRGLHDYICATRVVYK